MSETLRKVVVETMIPAKFNFMVRDLDGTVHVFENEPNPDSSLTSHDNIACTPHIGAATVEAQDRIGTELADQIKSVLLK